VESMIDASSIPVPRIVDLTSFDHGPDVIHASFPGTLLGNVLCLASGYPRLLPDPNRSKCSSSFLHHLSAPFPFPMAKLIVRGRKSSEAGGTGAPTEIDEGSKSGWPMMQVDMRRWEMALYAF
jgi:hypothetical protein